MKHLGKVITDSNTYVLTNVENEVYTVNGKQYVLNTLGYWVDFQELTEVEKGLGNILFRLRAIYNSTSMLNSNIIMN